MPYVTPSTHNNPEHPENAVTSWLRWDVDTAESDLLDDLAAILGGTIHPMRVMGHYFAMVNGLSRAGEWRLTDVMDARLERLARWDGDPGTWASAVRARCQDDRGMLRGYWRQAKLIEQRERDRRKARAAYRKSRGLPPDSEDTPTIREGFSEDNPRSLPGLSDAYGRDTDVTDGTDGTTTEQQHLLQRADSSKTPTRPATPRSGPTPTRTPAESRSGHPEAIKQIISDLPARDAATVAHAEVAMGVYAPALHGALHAARNPAALVGELRAMESGLHGDPVPWPDLGRALHELALAGRPVTGLALRRFVEKLSEAPLPARAGGRPGRWDGVAEKLDAEQHDA